MPKKYVSGFLTILLFLNLFGNHVIAQTLTSNRGGEQGGFHYEYWKDEGDGTMILGEGGNFSCTWDAHNILFRKGIRPGERNQTITYSADYRPNGNSYLTVYGWTVTSARDACVEFYIVESWGTWRPPGGQSRGTVESDGGTYDIYRTMRNNQPSILGTSTFPQYWSVRREKKESGIITCANHFDAWEEFDDMKLQNFYEVSFNVEGWISSGSADVTMSMDTGTTTSIISSNSGSSAKPRRTNGLKYLMVTRGNVKFLSFKTPVNSYVSFKVYNSLGQQVARIPGKEYSAGQHSVSFNASNLSGGVYYYSVKADQR